MSFTHKLIVRRPAFTTILVQGQIIQYLHGDSSTFSFYLVNTKRAIIAASLLLLTSQSSRVGQTAEEDILFELSVSADNLQSRCSF